MGSVVLLWPQVGPSQPSLQIQVKESPPPTQVPPFSQGPDAHGLVWAKIQRRRSVSTFTRTPKIFWSTIQRQLILDSAELKGSLKD